MSTSNSPQSVHVNGVDLTYVERGQGDSVVFVHGSVNDYRSWRGQLAHSPSGTASWLIAAATTGPMRNRARGMPMRSHGTPRTLAR
jgi:non-heme chloroperoxidase